eukprot:GHVR01178599.1.p1 GENE.GHVR01178599.1~~GHVR01178599.1.p1  ORF type:complete len:139 (-),score=78.87 GHVR01178599.1:155-571(-)
MTPLVSMEAHTGLYWHGSHTHTHTHTHSLYDSMGRSNLKAATRIANKLNNIYNYKYNNNNSNKNNKNGKKSVCVCECGQQNNSHACGIYTLIFADTLARQHTHTQLLFPLPENIDVQSIYDMRNHLKTLVCKMQKQKT